MIWFSKYQICLASFFACSGHETGTIFKSDALTFPSASIQFLGSKYWKTYTIHKNSCTKSRCWGVGIEFWDVGCVRITFAINSNPCSGHSDWKLIESYWNRPQIHICMLFLFYFPLFGVYSWGHSSSEGLTHVHVPLCLAFDRSP